MLGASHIKHQYRTATRIEGTHRLASVSKRVIANRAGGSESTRVPPGRKSERGNNRRRRQGSISIQQPEPPTLDTASPVQDTKQGQTGQDERGIGGSDDTSDVLSASWWQEVLDAEEAEADSERAVEATQAPKEEADAVLQEEQKRFRDETMRRRVAQFFRDEGLTADDTRNAQSNREWEEEEEEEERPMVQAAEFWDRPDPQPDSTGPKTGPNSTTDLTRRGFEPGNLWDAQSSSRDARSSYATSSTAGSPTDSPQRRFEPGNLWDAQPASRDARSSSATSSTAKSPADTAQHGFEPGNLWDAQPMARGARSSSATSSTARSPAAAGGARQATPGIAEVAELLQGGRVHREDKTAAEPDLANVIRGKEMSEEERRGRILIELASEGADVEALIAQHRKDIDEALLLTLFDRIKAANRYGEDEATVAALLSLWRRLRAEVERGMATPSERLLDEAMQLLTAPGTELQQLESTQTRLAAAFYPGSATDSSPIDVFAVAEALASGREPPSTIGAGADVEHVPLETFVSEVSALLQEASAANAALQQLVDSRDLTSEEQQPAEAGLKDRLQSEALVETVLTIADSLRQQPERQQLDPNRNKERRVQF